MSRLAAVILAVAVLAVGSGVEAPAVAGVSAAGASVAGSVPAGADDDRGRDGDPCRLLTRKDITRAFGQQAGRPTRDLGPQFCQWRLAESPTRAPGQVNVVLETGRAARRDYALGAQLSGELVEPVEGIGKKAFFTPDTGTLFVLAPGPTLYYVQANVYDADARRLTDGLKDQLVALAGRAEARV